MFVELPKRELISSRNFKDGKQGIICLPMSLNVCLETMKDSEEEISLKNGSFLAVKFNKWTLIVIVKYNIL